MPLCFNLQELVLLQQLCEDEVDGPILSADVPRLGSFHLLLGLLVSCYLFINLKPACKPTPSSVRSSCANLTFAE